MHYLRMQGTWTESKKTPQKLHTSYMYLLITTLCNEVRTWCAGRHTHTEVTVM